MFLPDGRSTFHQPTPVTEWKLMLETREGEEQEFVWIVGLLKKCNFSLLLSFFSLVFGPSSRLTTQIPPRLSLYSVFSSVVSCSTPSRTCTRLIRWASSGLFPCSSSCSGAEHSSTLIKAAYLPQPLPHHPHHRPQAPVLLNELARA